jgi:hypothetical protein
MEMILVKVVVHLNVHHIDQILLQAMEIKLHLDNQILDEEIARA